MIPEAEPSVPLSVVVAVIGVVLIWQFLRWFLSRSRRQ